MSEKKKKKIKVGIIGAGYMARKHLRAYKKMREVEVVGVVGKTERNRDYFIKECNVRNFYKNHLDLLSEGSVDAVSVVTPTFTHSKIVIDCFRAGCHVLCEKPISVNLTDAYEMIMAGEKAKKLFMMGFTMRFYKEFQRMKRLIDDGEIGDVRNAWFRKSSRLPKGEWYLDPEKSGGVIFEMGIHLIDWIRWIVGSRIEIVSAVMQDNVYNLGKEDNFWVLMEFENNAIGAVGSSYSYSINPVDIGVIGTTKSVSVEGGRIIQEDYRDSKPWLFNFYKKILPFLPIADNPFDKEISHFIDCIRDNTTPSVSARDGFHSLIVAFAALKSAKQRTKVVLEDFIREEFPDKDLRDYKY